MERGEVVFAILTVVAVLMVIWFLVGVMASVSAEKVNYVLLDKMGDNVEIRQYDDLTLITVRSDDTNSAFSTLARYISGNNQDNVKINMTAPVFSYREKGAVNMSFVLPEKYNSENVPMPDDPSIDVVREPSRKLATITFSGYISASAYEKNRSKLQETLDEHNIMTRGDYFMMRYNPPWIPPTLMRNEVAIEVE